MNRLIHEKSLYLRQHASNPVDWYPWGEEALRRARDEGRPVFLSIGYASCHWCHVMEREVFEDEEVARVLNEHFVPIKVDREERPDIDAAYMEAVQAMTGSGGWPLSVFLTPDLAPFFGGTYFPRDRFLSLLQAVVSVWTRNRDEVVRQGSRIVEALGRTAWLDKDPSGPLPDPISIAKLLLRQVDWERGGLEGRMKFPTVPVWRFLLHVHRRAPDASLARALRVTLDAMVTGGMYDHVGGGFHRYATDPDWIVPHFEKMLYDQALLADLYLEAGIVFGNALYERVAREVLDFVLSEMRAGAGLAASLDADSADGEGAYYTWTPTEIREALGEDVGQRLARLLRGEAEGGRSVLTRRIEKESDTEILQDLERYREVLLARRLERERPPLDPKVICAWNGLAIEVLARASRFFGERRYLQAAQEVLDHLWRVHRDRDGRLMRSSYGAEAANPAVLEDYAMLARGCIALYEATGSVETLQRAVDLCEAALRRFLREDGLFSMAETGLPATVGAGVDVMDGALPSGNAVLVEALLRLAGITGCDRYREASARALAAMRRLMERAPSATPAWHDAAMLLHGSLFEVVVAGEHPVGANSLVRALDQALPFDVVLSRVPEGGASPDLMTIAPSLAGKVALEGRPTAFVCLQGRCLAPVHDAGSLLHLLARGP